jgi:hypothetical protein
MHGLNEKPNKSMQAELDQPEFYQNVSIECKCIVFTKFSVAGQVS